MDRTGQQRAAQLVEALGAGKGDDLKPSERAQCRCVTATPQQGRRQDERARQERGATNQSDGYRAKRGPAKIHLLDPEYIAPMHGKRAAEDALDSPTVHVAAPVARKSGRPARPAVRVGSVEFEGAANQAAALLDASKPMMDSTDEDEFNDQPSKRKRARRSSQPTSTTRPSPVKSAPVAPPAATTLATPSIAKAAELSTPDIKKKAPPRPAVRAAGPSKKSLSAALKPPSSASADKKSGFKNGVAANALARKGGMPSSGNTTPSSKVLDDLYAPVPKVSFAARLSHLWTAKCLPDVLCVRTGRPAETGADKTVSGR